MKYPLGIQTFANLRRDSYIYVDKTQHLYDLIASGKHYFLSRPRRFGKSLLISTLDGLFRGEKALFEGLAIADSDYDFAVHPVVKLEFAKDEFASADSLREYIHFVLGMVAANYNIELNATNPNQAFEELIIKLYQQTGKQVVLLIDEYDKPILNNLHTTNLDEIRQIMRAFYSVAKAVDEHLKFVFITGVSKFAKVSVFSGMNNLTDISMDARYADICGITQQELESYFAQSIEQLVQLYAMSKEPLLEKVKIWYNGYCFHPIGKRVYNPYSLLSLFSKLEFKNYWFSTATPTFLLDLLQHKQYPLQDLTDLEVADSTFDACEPEEMSVQGVFIQTGYLTIKNYQDGLYQLDFPNREVKRSFFESVATRYGQLDHGQGASYASRLVQRLNADDIDGFIETFKVFFADIPYQINVKHEKYYQSLFYAILNILGFSLRVEVATNIGRIDCVIETNTHIYVIEFKLFASKEEALQQILDKAYAQKFVDSDKQIILLGVEFDHQKRNIGGYIAQSL